MGLKRWIHFHRFSQPFHKKVKAKFRRLINTFHSDILTEAPRLKFFSHTTLSDEIQEIIKSLNDKKAIGPNSILTKVLKKFGKTISISSFGKRY